MIIELIEVAVVAATTGVVGAVVTARRVLRGLALRRAEASVDVAPRVEPYRSASRVVVEEVRAPVRARRVRGGRGPSDEIVRWPRGLR